MKNTIFIVVGLILCFSGISVAAIVEDFDADPTQRGWVDSGDNFAWSAAGRVSGVNIKRHLENAFYVPLGTTMTASDSLSAKFDISYYGSTATSQFIYAGFLNSVDWFQNGTPDVNNVSNMMGALVSQHSSSGATYTKGRVANLGGDVRDSGWNFVASQGTWISYELIYTPGAGANSAGQFVLTAYSQGDFGGTPLETMASDLNVGDNFSLNSFGFFTGHTTANNSDGFIVYLDNVEVVPEPASAALCLAGLGLYLSRRRRNQVG